MPMPQQPIASPFTATSTTDEVLRGIDLRGRNIIVTGASAGLGEETARAFAAAGARLFLPVRSVEKGNAVAEQIRASTGNSAIEVSYMDLGVRESVRAFAAAFLRRDIPLHILVDNAGLMPATLERVDGNVEAQFGCNHLGHMLLTCLLAPALLRAAPSRVVVLSSAAHRRQPARFDDINCERHPYQKLEQYSLSKSANSLFAVELERRLGARGVSAFAVNPGPVFSAIQAAFTPAEMQALKFHDDDGNPAPWFRPPSVGAATTVWCATSPQLTAGGVYCEDCNIAELRRDAATSTGPEALKGVRPWAVDAELARELWEVSEGLLGERFGV